MSRRIALIVGVSQYESRTGLNSFKSNAPVHDAQRVYDVLSEYGGFDMLYPLPLADGKVDISGKVLAQALRDKLREVLNPQAGEEVELAVFYFSGHGVSHHGMASYLSATDDPLAVPLSFLTELVEDSTVKNLCIWLDCCHSGEVLKFKPSEKKSFCLVAASTADGESLAKNGQSLLTEILCEALTPDQDRPEIRVMEFVDYLEAHRKNLPQQVLFRGNSAFTLTQYHGEVSVASTYPPDHPPYKGLLTFTQIDREFFFGRDGMIQQLLDRLSASRFVPLLGASGSGKSSLVLAGLLPKLPESDWQVLVMRPTAQPLNMLKNTLVLGFADPQIGMLITGTDLHNEVSRLVTAGKRLLLVIDQFEEVFTECHNDDVRAEFFSCLLDALVNDNPLYVVLTLRADFMGRCADYPSLANLLQNNTLILTAPHPNELRDLITLPLSLVGMRIEEKLTSELMVKSSDSTGSLPLLQYVLDKLWQEAQNKRSREIDWDSYQKIGGEKGLSGILNKKADDFYRSLDSEQQQLLEWLMVELIQISDSHDDVRRTLTLQELCDRQPKYNSQIMFLVEKITTEERLLTKNDKGGQEAVTIAHEALIRDWRLLRNWLEANHDIKVWRSRIEEDIQDWRKNGDLLHGGRLAEAQQIIKRYSNSLLIGDQEHDFIKKSLQRQAADERERRRIHNELVIEKLTGKSALAIRSPSSANGSLEQGLLLAITAFSLNATSPAVLASLLDGLQAAGYLHEIYYLKNINKNEVHAFWSKNPIETVENKKDFFQYMICGNGDNTLVLWKWDATNKDQPCIEGETWYGHADMVRAVAFNPDGKYVISGSNDRTLRLWDVSAGVPIGEAWQGHTSSVTSVVFSHDGSKVASGSNDGSIIIWDVYNGVCIRKLEQAHQNAITAIVFSSDDYYIATGSEDNALKLWSIQDCIELRRTWKEHKNGITAIAFQPLNIKNKRKFFQLLSSDKDGFLMLSKIQKEREHIEKYSTVSSWHWHDDSITAIAFSPDGQYALTSSQDYTIRVWNINNKQALCKWVKEINGITSIAFSPAEQDFIMGFRDGSLQLRSTVNGKIKRKLYGHDDQVNSISYSPSEDFFVTGSADGKLISWRVKDFTKRYLDFHRGTIKSIAFSVDGRYIVSCGEDQQVVLWDIASNTIMRKWSVEKPISAVFVNNDKNLIIADGNALISLDVASDDLLGALWRKRHKDPINCLGVSENRQYLITGSGNFLYLWNTETKELIGTPWRGHKSQIIAAGFGNGDNYVISASMDCTIRLWDRATGIPIGEPWCQHEISVMAMAISSSGRHVVSAGLDMTLALWDADPESWAKKACSIVKRNFSLAEWQRFIGDALPYQKTCQDLPAPGEDGWVEPYAGG